MSATVSARDLKIKLQSESEENIMPPSHEPKPVPLGGFGDAVREFNAWVRDHPKLEQVKRALK